MHGEVSPEALAATPSYMLFEKLLFSFVLFLALWGVSCCWRAARRNQRNALSDDGDRRGHYKPVRTEFR
jgi:hypothetical protein